MKRSTSARHCGFLPPIKSNFAVAPHHNITSTWPRMKRATDAEPGVAKVSRFSDGPVTPAAPPQMQVDSSTGKYEHKATFTKEQIGGIIGKGGSVIRGIRESTGAWITIDQGTPGGTELREVRFSSTSPEQLLRAVSECMRIAQENTAVEVPIAADPSAAAAISINVPASLIGRVIGKSGDMIRQIQDQSGARLKIASEVTPGTTDKQITFSGTEQAMTAALDMVTKIMQEAPQRANSRDPAPAGLPPALAPPNSYAPPPPGYQAAPQPGTVAPPGYAPPPPGYILVPALPPPAGYAPPPGFLCVAAPQAAQPVPQYTLPPQPAPYTLAPHEAYQQYMQAPTMQMGGGLPASLPPSTLPPAPSQYYGAM